LDVRLDFEGASDRIDSVSGRHSALECQLPKSTVVIIYQLVNVNWWDVSFAADIETDTRKIERALRGEILYGDDFAEPEISQWFDDEREGFYDLYYHTHSRYVSRGNDYAFDEVSHQHGFRWLPVREFDAVLGIGSAHGAELKPLLSRSRTITILEPADGFASSSLGGKPVVYVQPRASGMMPFATANFDVAVCFGVLHHIANVSTVVGEIFRVLAPGGYALIREPTISMGDWRRPRPGLTKRERGIPLPIFRRLVADAGFEVVRETRCMFSLTSLLRFVIDEQKMWRMKSIVKIDAALCKLPVWPNKYDEERLWHKIRPTAVAFVLRKPE
jgi:SAM-dependent methyltransferase